MNATDLLEKITSSLNSTRDREIRLRRSHSRRRPHRCSRRRKWPTLAPALVVATANPAQMHPGMVKAAVAVAA